MGKIGDALRVLLENANLSDPGQRDTVEAAIDEDEEKNPTPEEKTDEEKEEEKTGDKESGRTQAKDRITSGIQQRKDGK